MVHYSVLSEGKAVKVSEESIQITVLGFSSAVITAENIRDEFEYELVSAEYQRLCHLMYSLI